MVRLDYLTSPGCFTAYCRAAWLCTGAVLRHFAGKPVFAAWPREVLKDYVQHGTEPDPEGVCLRFLPEAEARIYRTLPR